jgi:hypothetical protein
VSLLCLICGVAILLAQVANWSGLRDRWAAARAEAEAERLEAAAARERQLPLIVASLADTVAASAYAAADRVALIALVVYVLCRRRDRREGGGDD